MNNKTIFIINGSGGTGKDALVSEMAKIAGVVNYSSIDDVKELMKQMGWDGVTKTEHDRKMMADLKQLWIAYNDGPFKAMQKKVEEFNESDSEILFLHIREPEEIEKAKKAFGAIALLVIRKTVSHIVSNDADKNVANYNYDVVVDNSGTLEDLANKVATIYKDLSVNMLKKAY